MQWESTKLSQSKLEEIARVLDEITHSYIKLSAEALEHIEFGKPFQFTGPKIPFGRLTILVQFYAPSLEHDLEVLKEKTKSYGHIIVDVVKTDNFDSEHKNRVEYSCI